MEADWGRLQRVFNSTIQGLHLFLVTGVFQEDLTLRSVVETQFWQESGG